MLIPAMSLVLATTLVIAVSLLKGGWDTSMGTDFCWYDIAANGTGVDFASALFIFV